MAAETAVLKPVDTLLLFTIHCTTKTANIILQMTTDQQVLLATIHYKQVVMFLDGVQHKLIFKDQAG